MIREHMLPAFEVRESRRKKAGGETVSFEKS